METFVLNLFGVPGAGKSTTAAYIFAKLKIMGVNAELVTEYAKDKVWEENQTALKSQPYVFGEQFYKLDRCRDKVELIITDSPILLSILFGKQPYLGKPFNDLVVNCFNSFNNINYLIERVNPYVTSGRLQTEEEAEALKAPLLEILNKNNIPYQEIKGDIKYYDKVIDDVYSKIENSRNMEKSIAEHYF